MQNICPQRPTILCVEPWKDFAKWQDLFEQRLRYGSLAWKAFAAWQQHVRELQESGQRIPTFKHLPGDPYILPQDIDPKSYVLNKLYYWTRPLDVGRGKPSERLLRDIDKFTKVLERRSRQFKNDYINKSDSLEGYDDDDQWLVMQLSSFYLRTAQISREAQSFLSHFYQHELDLLDQCLPLIARLKYVVRVPEREILALVKIALEANGHTRDLAIFDPDVASAKRGTARKRLSRRISEYTNRQKLLAQLIENLRTR